MLNKIQMSCSVIAICVINSCSQEARLFISGSEEITIGGRYYTR